MSGSGEGFTVNSEQTWTAFVKYARDLYDQNHYVTWPAPRIGRDRSLDQNALFHVWMRECAAHYLRKDKRDITEGELEGMKRAAKKQYYLQNPHPFVIHELVNPLTGEKRRDFSSSATWKKGEMFHFLTWLQHYAACDNLILESRGEFAKLQRDQDT